MALDEDRFQSALQEAREKFPYLNEDRAKLVAEKINEFYATIMEKAGKVRDFRDLLATAVRMTVSDDYYHRAYRHFAGKYFGKKKSACAGQNKSQARPATQTKKRQPASDLPIEANGQYSFRM